MIRKIITIDSEKCDGCGLCVNACREGAIGLSCGKAVLLRDDYCDGLGNCLPACPQQAISFEEREAAAFTLNVDSKNEAAAGKCLQNWPLQIKLVSPNASYFNNCDLLIAADCTAFCYKNFYDEFTKNHITIIGCPKLDAVDYSENLANIFSANNIKSITVTRMEVPCCGGLEWAVKEAVKKSAKHIPVKCVTLSIEGCVLSTEEE
ncbi:MAG: 4Fe-4S binding protein [Termitinemataceae bacterium]|nr:MAG: 4Fe-4S binding protein [Termitinemataceae bacterium]